MDGVTLFGRVPGWALTRGRDGYGSGSGYGFGDGDGYGFGDGEQLERCKPIVTVLVTVADLRKHDACDGAAERFEEAFPEGASFPEDLDAAFEAGLDVRWLAKRMGLLLPVDEAA